MDVQQPTRTKMPGVLRMIDGTELPVSRRRWPEINQFFQQLEADQVSDAPLLPPAVPADREAIPRFVVLAIMAGDALMVTQQRLDLLQIDCLFQTVDRGAELANLLLLNPGDERPSLILLDARTNRADRMITLRSLKSHPELWAIPIVWLALPGDDVTAVLELDANSVVEVPDEPVLFSRAIDQIYRYWLLMVQLPRIELTRTKTD